MSISPKAATAQADAITVTPSLRASRTRQVEPAAEEVRGDRKQVVADAEHDAAMGRAAAEPVLRQDRARATTRAP